MPASTQFALDGFIEAATLDASCAANAHCGGTITVNGQTVIVPKETIVVFPANQLTWQETFSQAPAPYGLAAAPAPETGLAMTDLPLPLTTYEANVIGNRVLGGPAGADVLIAGLITISQHATNSGQGFINFIDYTTGAIWVGGTPLGTATGTQLQLNDPAGRYGRVSSPDVRFTSDPDNPTVVAGTGFPMCIPRSDPTGATPDALCPEAQRNPSGVLPAVYTAIVRTTDPTNPAIIGAAKFPDPTIQIPFEVGDFVTWSGTLVTNNAAAPTVAPLPAGGLASTFVSVHTLVNNVAVYTFPGTDPAYTFIDTSLIGTGGLTVLGAAEASARTRFEGMTTDATRNVHLFAVDFDPLTGAAQDRDLGVAQADPGPIVGAVQGRWRFRPPCVGTLPFGAFKGNGTCTPSPTGTFLPPPREVRAVVESVAQVRAWVPGQALTAANGIIYGQYHAPIAQYIFPENVPGQPVVPNNFGAIPFLAQGGYTSTLGTLVGQLNPWPDSSTPSPACTPPVATSGGPYQAAAGGTVQLNATASGTAPITFAWTVGSGSLSSSTIANPVFNATGAVSPVTASVTATNFCGSSTASTTITINPAPAPTLAPLSSFTVASGAPATFAVSATDPQGLAVTFTATQAGAPALIGLTVTAASASSANVSFTAPTLAPGAAPDIVTLTIVATNAAGSSSPPGTLTVTVNPATDNITIALAQYIIARQRLNINANSTVVSPTNVLTVQDYLATDGTIFNLAAVGNTMTNTGAGAYTFVAIGVPEPALPPAAPIVVKSSLGGTSPASKITTK
jgi:hypothetical protein